MPGYKDVKPHTPVALTPKCSTLIRNVWPACHALSSTAPRRLWAPSMSVVCAWWTPNSGTALGCPAHKCWRCTPAMTPWSVTHKVWSNTCCPCFKPLYRLDRVRRRDSIFSAQSTKHLCQQGASRLGGVLANLFFLFADHVVQPVKGFARHMVFQKCFVS